MNFSIAESAIETIPANWLMVFHVEESDEFSSLLTSIDERLGGSLTRMVERDDLTGKQAELVVIPDVPNLAVDRLIVVGLGKEAELNKASVRKAISTAIRKTAGKAEQALAIEVPVFLQQRFEDGEALALITEAIRVACCPQNLYQKEQSRFPFERVEFLELVKSKENEDAIHRGEVLGESINLTRELVNRHPDDIYPATFANRIIEEFAHLEVVDDVGVQIEVLDQQQIEQEKMGALLAVAKGSSREPKVVVLRYDGGGSDGPTIGLIGKGVTFDSGGLSIKSSSGMISMKSDMAGAATVIGVVKAIAELKVAVNLIAVVGLVENMTGGSAYKLGDVVTARNGTTVEIHNTDAEGRLVLADILSYAIDQGAERLVDFATLTGACVVALGEDVVGAFTNHDDWCERVINSTRAAGEEIWQLPMYDSYADQLKSNFADCKNVGSRWGGAITAAKFLEKFVADKPWVHLDIAGPSFADSESSSRDPGGTGVMVRSIVRLLGEDLA